MRILMVHDTPLFREGLRSFLLRQEDCSLVGEATQLEEVLSLVRTECPDIVLLDGELTSADPLALTQQLRELGVPGILILAAPTADEETFFQFFKYGATAYVDGTIPGTELMEKLRKISLGEYLMDSEVLSTQAARRTRQVRFRQAVQQALRAEALELAREISPLSDCERRILEQAAQGQENAHIARQLGTNERAIKNQLYQLMRKIHATNRTEAVVIALSRAWITIETLEEKPTESSPQGISRPRVEAALTATNTTHTSNAVLTV